MPSSRKVPINLPPSRRGSHFSSYTFHAAPSVHKAYSGLRSRPPLPPCSTRAGHSPMRHTEVGTNWGWLPLSGQGCGTCNSPLTRPRNCMTQCSIRHFVVECRRRSLKSLRASPVASKKAVSAAANFSASSAAARSGRSCQQRMAVCSMCFSVKASQAKASLAAVKISAALTNRSRTVDTSGSARATSGSSLSNLHCSCIRAKATL
mmetsp:Transcript_98256/g.170296  ORF Transcript_98256/g.170296 Transcript_98256/m.170296 type:complete len:206 (-) Transcript_98256:69-686(-)